MDPWSAAAAAAVGGAFDIAGGFLSRPKHSQRDLMHMQHQFWERQMDQRYPRQVRSMRRAGLNPILAVSQPPPAPSVPQIGQGQLDPLGEGVSRAGKSAREAAMATFQSKMMTAQTDKAEADASSARANAHKAMVEAGLVKEQTKTESVKRFHLHASIEQMQSAAQLNRMKTIESQINQKIMRLNVTGAHRDALMASIDLALYAGEKGPLMRIIERVGVGGAAAKGLIQNVDTLRSIGGSLWDRTKSAAREAWETWKEINSFGIYRRNK